MNVEITVVLKSYLQSDGIDDQLFCQMFANWKGSGEYDSHHFGKDSAYSSPTVNGRYLLRHVHLVPVIDKNQLKSWEKRWKTRSRKTSDRVLIYASDGKGGYLLIFILSEPDAHEIAQMKQHEHKQLMHRFAEISEQFVDHGLILA